ncbi:hypothetical protein F0562_007589 [Nyssa sinensis]|uniref:Retrotransposon gag domain-containing protein n=1 Tax=Nyssa sinensis TaxID=561372 RepID=A0A5J5A6A7_9ASTE|nr:hypothetical protein F0562_007589 [Nyssa sinensis]
MRQEIESIKRHNELVQEQLLAITRTLATLTQNQAAGSPNPSVNFAAGTQPPVATENEELHEQAPTNQPGHPPGFARVGRDPQPSAAPSWGTSAFVPDVHYRSTTRAPTPRASGAHPAPQEPHPYAAPIPPVRNPPPSEGRTQPYYLEAKAVRQDSQDVRLRDPRRVEEIVESMDRTIALRGPQNPPEQDELAKLLGRLATPFTHAIMSEERPRKFMVPKFTLYDGSGDLGDHLSHYQHTMALHGASDAFMCRTFITSLKGTALKWFHNLPPNSITSFYELGRQFLDSKKYL